MSTTLLNLEELAELEERQSHILPEGTLMDRAGFVCAYHGCAAEGFNRVQPVDERVAF